MAPNDLLGYSVVTGISYCLRNVTGRSLQCDELQGAFER